LHADARDIDIWTIPIDGDRKPRALIEGPGPQSVSSISPDGRWIAYNSNESAIDQAIYVQPFPPTGAKYLVSAKGVYPSWSPDGKQLYYLEAGFGYGFTAKLLSVDVVTQKGFEFSKPTSMFEMITFGGAGRPYDVMPNGKGFLALLVREASSSDASAPQINVVLNWFTELQRRVPVK
jgi:hypothetical protein